MPERKRLGWEGQKKNWLANPGHEGIYHSTRWRKLTAWYKMNHPVCEMEGCTQPSKYTDHIKPISEGGDIWNEQNLQALCVSCNAKKTAKQSKKGNH